MPDWKLDCLHLFKKMLSAVTFKEAHTDGFSEEAMNEQALKKLFQEENLIHDNICSPLL